MSRLLIVLAATLAVCGCQTDSAPPQTSALQTSTPQGTPPQAAPAQVVLVRPGGTPAQFAVDRYECMRASQQPVSRTAPDAKGVAVTTTAQTTNGQLYAACMSTRGYYASRAPDPSIYGGPATQAALAARRQDMMKVCFNPAYAAYYARTSCAPLGMTPAQLADTSRISPSEKAVFLQARHAANAAQDAVLQVLREGSLRGQKAVELFFETYRPQLEKADRDLYSGAITWGAYNTSLVEIMRAYQGDAAQTKG